MYVLHRWRIPPRNSTTTKMHIQLRVPGGSPLLLTTKDTTNILTTVSSPVCEMLCFPKEVRVTDRVWHDGDVTIAAELIQSHDSTLTSFDIFPDATTLTSHR